MGLKCAGDSKLLKTKLKVFKSARSASGVSTIPNNTQTHTQLPTQTGFCLQEVKRAICQLKYLKLQFPKDHLKLTEIACSGNRRKNLAIVREG